MDPIDILGSLLGGKKGGGGGLGADILGQILTGGKSDRAPTKPAPERNSDAVVRRPNQSGPIDINQEARELEDLLNVATERRSQRIDPAPTRVPQAVPQSTSSSTSPFSFPTSRNNVPPPARRAPADYRNDPQQANEDAIVLIRAMINAAKSDGSISQPEQQAILERLGNPTDDVIQFLRQEFAQSLDVREFAWSVPIGMEQKVYMISLAAIDLDDNKEAAYLRDLAHGLRIAPELCNQIHRQYGAPEIY